MRKRRKTAVFQIDYIDYGRRLLLRGGRTRRLKRRLLVNLRSRWSMADMVYFRLRTLFPISRAVLRNP